MATATTDKGANVPAQTAKAAKAAKPAVKPSKVYGPIKLEKLTWYKDPTTDKGEWALTVSTLGELLQSIGVFDGTTFDSKRIITTEAQRTILKITPTSKKASMMRHVLRGGPVPTVIMTVKGDRLSPLDGLQRCDVHSQVAQALLQHKHDPSGSKEQAVIDALAKLKELNYGITDFDSLMEIPMKVEIWRGLDATEEDRKFGTWNLDATPISTRHMAEILHGDLRTKIHGWGLKTDTEKERATPLLDGEGKPVAKARKAKGEKIKPEDVVRPLATVQVMLYAFLAATNKADKTAMLDERAHGRIHDQLKAYGEDVVAAIMKKMFIEIIPAMHAKYDSIDNLAAQQIKKESETLFVPAMAAIGYAVQEKVSAAKILEWMDSLIELLSGEEVDPLGLVRGLKSWTNLLEDKTLKGSAGQKARKLHFYGWRNAIVNGLPFDWEKALRDASNAS